jgi:DNA-binding transcriptional MerR regulator
MSKSAEAFRTIGEVADELDVPKHVLRFWEGKFPHIRPMKRGGGRRYYRPEDMELLRGIRHLLHAEGYTIKGVQKILREQGIDQVKAASAASSAAASAAVATKDARGSKTRASKAGAKSGLVNTATKQTVSTEADKPASATSSEARTTAKATPDDAKRGPPSGSKPAPHTTHDIIAAAIRELEICRQILAAGAGTATVPAAPRLRSARS